MSAGNIAGNITVGIIMFLAGIVSLVNGVTNLAENWPLIIVGGTLSTMGICIAGYGALS